MKDKEQHHDECDCITCRARVEKGGLDYDPSNNDDEFEEHERQVLRDVGITEEEKPELKLVGEDGNVFNILGLATRSARRAGWSEEKIKEFQEKAMSGDYNNALATCMDYFDVI